MTKVPDNNKSRLVWRKNTGTQPDLPDGTKFLTRGIGGSISIHKLNQMGINIFSSTVFGKLEVTHWCLFDEIFPDRQTEPVPSSESILDAMNRNSKTADGDDPKPA